MKHPDSVRYQAIRRYGDARGNGEFGEQLDAHVDSFLDHLKEHARDAYNRLRIAAIKGEHP